MKHNPHISLFAIFPLSEVPQITQIFPKGFLKFDQLPFFLNGNSKKYLKKKHVLPFPATNAKKLENQKMK